MKRRSLGIILIATAMLSAAPAGARKQDDKARDPLCDPMMQLNRRVASPVALLIAGFDANGDAKVDRAELKAGTDRMFRLADQDHDGVISLIELSEWSATWLGNPSALPGRFDFDRDQDDKISKAEFSAELERRFTALDANKDGMLDRSELLGGPPPVVCTEDGRRPAMPGRGQAGQPRELRQQ